MDRRQLLEEVGVRTVVGELADNVVLAAAEARERHLGADAHGTLVEALALVRALSAFEQPEVTTPASLDCMAAPEAVSETFIRMRPAGDSGSLDEVLNSVEADLDCLLHKSSDEAAISRVQSFFAALANGLLESSEALLKPHSREVSWMSTASSF